MPILSDFTVIQGDAIRRIGDGATLWEKTFNTGGRRSDGQAIMMFMIKGLTASPTDVNIKINNRIIGVIERYPGADPRYWFTQIVSIGGNNLNDGNNELQIEAIPYDKGGPTDHFDDFYIKDVVCFFQQKS